MTAIATAEDNLERTLEEVDALRSILGNEDSVLCQINNDTMEMELQITVHPNSSYQPTTPSPVTPQLTLVAVLSPHYPSHAPPRCHIVPSSVDSSVYAQYQIQFANFWADAEGEVMLYDCIQWLSEQLTEWLATRTQQQEARLEQTQHQQQLESSRAQAKRDLLLDCSKRFVHGETLTDRRSIFQAHLVHTTQVNEIPLLLRALKSDRKIAAAAHNIWSYRIGGQFADNDDDGETAAGKRLALLLDHSSANNVFVVVTRWYGGIHLGPDRFRHINNVARILMVRENVIRGSGGGGGGSGGGNGDGVKKKRTTQHKNKNSKKSGNKLPSGR